MALSSVPDILDDIRAGKMVILMDDEDRENEGDLIIAAEAVTPEVITFFSSEACGRICMHRKKINISTVLACNCR